jgi:hypothetical protein
MADFNSIADMIESCAAEAVLIAREQFGFTLDYSDRSIQSLETILASIAVGLDTSDKESIEQAVKIWGSYLGEVARRSFGGAWELVQPPGRVAAVPTLVMGGSQLYPMMKIYRRLTMGEPENVWKFYERIRPRLSPVHPTDSFAN